MADHGAWPVLTAASNAARNGHEAVLEHILTTVQSPMIFSTTLGAVAEGGYPKILALIHRLNPAAPASTHPLMVFPDLGKAVSLDFITHLLHKAPEDAKDSMWSAALQGALEHKRLHIVRGLVQPGVVRAYESGFFLPVLSDVVAAHSTNAELRFLRDSGLGSYLAAGADSALAKSIERGDIEMATSWIRDHGANPRSDDNLLLYLAAAAGSAPMMQLLCDATNVSFETLVPNGDLVSYLRTQSTTHHVTALTAAIRHHHLPALRLLFDRVSSLPLQMRMITLIVELGHSDMLVEVLSPPPANSFAKYERPHVDAVCAAAKRGDVNTMAVLLDRCKSLFAQKGSARSILCGAVDSGCLPLLDLLWARLKIGADSVSTDDGPTPALSLPDLWVTLHRAAAMGHAPVCRQIFQFVLEYRPGDEAVSRCGELYFTSDSSPSSELDVTGLMRFIADAAGLDVETETSVLPVAARHGQLEVCEYLLDRGVDVQTQANEALKLAYLNGHAAVVQLLLAHGANRAVISDDTASR